ncbi:reverse transcriptase domain-containing protein [Tanacetum coccineum]
MDPAIVMCKNSGHGEDGEKIMELGMMDMDGSATKKMDNGDDGREGDEGTRLKIIVNGRIDGQGVQVGGQGTEIMPPRMTTRSAGRATAAPRGGRNGGQTSRGGGRTRGRSGDQGNGRIDGQGGQVGGQGTEVNDGVDGVPGFSTIIAQQLQNLLPTILSQGKVRNVIENNERWGCTYKEFLAYNLKEYDGKGGAIVYTHWIKKMESVQDMSGCRDNQKVKYTAASFVGKAFTWWNSQIHTWSREAGVSMSWENFKTLTREKFCPSNERKKLETELWNHVMVEAGHATYTDRFHELARLVPHLVTPENERIERYVYGLASQIQGMVVATEPTTIQKAMQIASTLIDEAIRNGSIKKNLKKRGN